MTSLDNQFDEMIECIKMLKIISDELIKFITEIKGICNDFDAKIADMKKDEEVHKDGEDSTD